MANLPAVPDADNFGLEDFDIKTDMVMPKLQIDHTDGVLVDTLSGEKFEKISVVLLGLVKQRILWPPEVTEQKENPLCRSLNFHEGQPDPENPQRFPWSASGLDQPTSPMNVACSECKLKDWGSNPKNDSPWCTEQWTFPLAMMVNDLTWGPATLTLQRSNLKPARSYLSSYARAKEPLFTAVTEVKMNPMKRGSVKYVTLSFSKGAPTDIQLHPEFRNEFLRIRDWLQAPRSSEERAAVEEDKAVANPRSAAAVDIDEEF